jgi:hypothetical protein
MDRTVWLRGEVPMSDQISFTKYENKIVPQFRQKINSAESTEDVKKFFIQTTKDLLNEIFEGTLDFRYDDVELMPDADPYYRVSHRLGSSKNFASVWNGSDLSRVMFRLASSASHRYRHLMKNPEKRDAKIRM